MSLATCADKPVGAFSTSANSASYPHGADIRWSHEFSGEPASVTTIGGTTEVAASGYIASASIEQVSRSAPSLSVATFVSGDSIEYSDASIATGGSNTLTVEIVFTPLGTTGTSPYAAEIQLFDSGFGRPWGLRRSGGSWEILIEGGATVALTTTAGTETHVVSVLDYAGGTYSVTQDGTSRGTGSLTRSADTGGQFFIGPNGDMELSFLRPYNVALSSSAVTLQVSEPWGPVGATLSAGSPVEATGTSTAAASTASATATDIVAVAGTSTAGISTASATATDTIAASGTSTAAASTASAAAADTIATAGTSTAAASTASGVGETTAAIAAAGTSTAAVSTASATAAEVLEATGASTAAASSASATATDVVAAAGASTAAASTASAVGEAPGAGTVAASGTSTAAASTAGATATDAVSVAGTSTAAVSTASASVATTGAVVASGASTAAVSTASAIAAEVLEVAGTSTAGVSTASALLVALTAGTMQAWPSRPGITGRGLTGSAAGRGLTGVSARGGWS